jgi:hypothetical protein
MTTTQPTVTKAGESTTASQTISSTNIPTTIPTQTATTSEQVNKTTTPPYMISTQSTTGTQDSHISTTEDSQYVSTESTEPSTTLVDISRYSSPATPIIREARVKDSEYRVWVIPVAVCLAILVVTAIVLLVYVKW